MGQEDNCSADVPTSEVYLSQLSTGYIVAISLCCVVSLTVCVLYLEQLHFFFKRLGTWKPKDKAVWLLGIYPVFCITSMVALLVPRSALLDSLVASLYLSICVYLFNGMLIGHYGGAEKMSRKLAQYPIPVRSGPCCCCCLCLPHSVQMSTFRLQILETLVLQYAILKPMISYVAAILSTDDKFQTEDLNWSSAYLWLSLINAVSTVIALYGFFLVYTVSRAPLQKMTVKPKYVCLQLVIIIANFQRLIIGIFVNRGVIPCDPPLNAKSNGERWHHMCVIFEMLCIALAARMYYRRHVGEKPSDVETITENMAPTATTLSSVDHGMSADLFNNGALVLRDVDSAADSSEVTLSVTTRQMLSEPGANDVRVGIDNPVYEGHVTLERSPSNCAMAGSLAGTPTEENKVHIQVTKDASEV